ncbi:hypothetical protein [Streptomyces sp. NBC_00503]|uniref:hypothetical protein n=1 Tax=Streptomyces sp. NBC_00503 TaxID=2903659 RepID=UPI002E80F5C1|nr:hypothetical protein [Streptomyces sp. NBC_00503]WUD84479.1 hypothetical protein OG490_30140 [Streptomyces sp. NBC_00503]
MAAWLRRRSGAPVYDQAYGDRGLEECRQDLVMGRWEGVRDLLAEHPREDWDRRAHRIRLLADAAASSRTVDVWYAADPGNPDAALLRAETEVMRMFAAASSGAMPGRDALDQVARACLRACDLAPQDPHPYVCLVTLGRLYEGGDPNIGHWWQELRARDPHHREGHHQVLRYLSARWHGSHGESYNFAWDGAVYAPPGSPLAVLPQVARVEQYRHEREAQGQSAVGLATHWSGERARWDLRTALENWIAQRTRPYAQDVADLNYLAHGLVHGGMEEESVEVFALLDNRATRIPWSYSGDPEALFIRWRDRAQTLGASR